MAKKIRVALLVGGKSGEHEISLLSAKNVMKALDKEKYEVSLVGIDKEGRWHPLNAARFQSLPAHPSQIALKDAKEELALIAKKGDDKELIRLSDNALAEKIDVVFPVLHGTNGEDGTVQGLLKLANIPFVGAGVLGSAVGMDKDVMKRLLRDGGLRIAKFLTFQKGRNEQIDFAAIKKELGLPLFVKPANLGSSVGVSKARDEKEFRRAIDLAFQYDRKILVEEFIEGREIECSIIGNDHPIASLPGEVIYQDEFHSYEAKYFDDRGTVFKIPAEIDASLIAKIQSLCIQAYQVLSCEGLARIDLFLQKEGTIYINEINTIPGFTNQSMFPKQWEASGMPLAALVDHLIGFAIE